MAKFILFKNPGISMTGSPGYEEAHEVVLRVSEIRSMCHSKYGYFVSTDMIDRVIDARSQRVVSETNMTLKVSKEDYELTKKVLSEQDGVTMKLKGSSIFDKGFIPPTSSE